MSAIIGITGGTGFVGSHLAGLLADKGYAVIVFTRDISQRSRQKNISYSYWDPGKKKCDIAGLRELNAMVHLAGAGIADKRWTEKRKKEIVQSRVAGTELLVAQLGDYAPFCKTLIAASAIGYYGPDKADKMPFSEASPPHNDFLGNTCMQWEAASHKAEAFARTVIVRFGIVLGRDGGAFPKFARPLSFGIKPVLGSGNQVISWIHVDDLAQFLLFALEHAALSGIYNAVTPHPVSYSSLMDTIAEAKGGLKLTLPVPALLLQLVLGELSSEILKSCTVSAKAITNSGFNFRYPHLADAVRTMI
jgi:uncharacterized protein